MIPRYVWARRTKRASHEAAHLVDGNESPCPWAQSRVGARTLFALKDGTKPPRGPFVAVDGADLSPSGQPFGKTCAWCLKHVPADHIVPSRQRPLTT